MSAPDPFEAAGSEPAAGAGPSDTTPHGLDAPTPDLPSLATHEQPSEPPITPAPAIPAPPLVVPPVVVPAVPVPPALIQAIEEPCVPGSGPRPSNWREPLPPTPRHNPDGPKRVGLQAGHWLTEQVPAELRGLQHGAIGGGKMEWEVNLDIGHRTKALLEAQGVVVDILPTTVPIRYRAHLFVSIHADGDTTCRTSGFKIAHPAFSSLPSVDDRLVESLYAAYGAATGLRRDDEHITSRMRYYYAFNSRRFCHAVAPGVPQAIVETGFLTNAADRQLLIARPDVIANGIADGILRFLRENP
ncbi:MAG: N-acetylmuramoyl-L-alanine amidase [Chloroflexi bacterium]|nr:N-acetylmuramoyl-L-alanine amidase [Chloroflexota bacterium]